MKIAIIHEIFEEPGGAELLSLYLYKALKELNYDVVYYTFYLNKISFNIVKRNVDIDLDIKEIKTRTIKDFEKYLGLKFLRLRHLLMYDLVASNYIDKIRKNHELIIFNTQSNFPIGSDISYIHYPSVINYLKTSNKSIINNVYEMLINYEINRLNKKYKKTKLILTNSKWTKSITNKVYPNVKKEVLNPPIGNDLIVSNSFNNKIITISRFIPEKNLDAIIDVASKLRNLEFYIMGATTQNSTQVLEKINKKIKYYNLKNVYIETNVSRKRIIDIMSESTFYLHPPFPEHFGISVAEAAASGLIPVVYRNGGAYTDIVAKIDPSLSYNNLNEVVDTLTKLHDNKQLLDKLRTKAIKVGNLFSCENFKCSLNKILETTVFNQKNDILKTI